MRFLLHYVAFGFIGRECVGPQHVRETVKHGGGLMMIWRFMTTFGSGAWYKIDALRYDG